MNLSYWELESFFKNIDVLIVGSGIVGLNAALTLKEKSPNLHVVIAEKGCLPAGASTKNAGFSCFGSVSELLDDMKSQDEDFVLGVLEKRWLGLQRLKERVGAPNMDYYEYGNFEVFRKEDAELFEECHSKMDSLNQRLKSIIGLPETFSLANDKIDHFGFAGVQQLIWNKGEGQIHTGKMMHTLLHLAREKGIQIFNGITINNLEDTGSEVLVQANDSWEFKAKQVLIATNGFAKRLHPNLNVNPARNQVLITKPIPDLSLQGAFHYNKGYVYFRNIENRILLGGGRHLDVEGETTAEFGFTDTIQTYLTDLLHRVIAPQHSVEIDHWWSGIMGVGEAKKPLVQRQSNRIALAVRMGGMGVAIGSLIGEEGAHLLLE